MSGSASAFSSTPRTPRTPGGGRRSFTKQVGFNADENSPFQETEEEKSTGSHSSTIKSFLKGPNKLNKVSPELSPKLSPTATISVIDSLTRQDSIEKMNNEKKSIMKTSYTPIPSESSPIRHNERRTSFTSDIQTRESTTSTAHSPRQSQNTENSSNLVESKDSQDGHNIPPAVSHRTISISSIAHSIQGSSSSSSNSIDKDDKLTPSLNQAAINAQANARNDLEGLKVLVVDDSVPILKMTSYVLNRAGCVVTEAKNGYVALRSIHENRYDLILMDIQMPGMYMYTIFFFLLFIL